MKGSRKQTLLLMLSIHLWLIYLQNNNRLIPPPPNNKLLPNFIRSFVETQDLVKWQKDHNEIFKVKPLSESKAKKLPQSDSKNIFKDFLFKKMIQQFIANANLKEAHKNSLITPQSNNLKTDSDNKIPLASLVTQFKENAENYIGASLCEDNFRQGDYDEWFKQSEVLLAELRQNLSKMNTFAESSNDRLILNGLDSNVKVYFTQLRSLFIDYWDLWANPKSLEPSLISKLISDLKTKSEDEQKRLFELTDQKLNLLFFPAHDDGDKTNSEYLEIDDLLSLAKYLDDLIKSTNQFLVQHLLKKTLMLTIYRISKTFGETNKDSELFNKYFEHWMTTDYDGIVLCVEPIQRLRTEDWLRPNDNRCTDFFSDMQYALQKLKTDQKFSFRNFLKDIIESNLLEKEECVLALHSWSKFYKLFNDKVNLNDLEKSQKKDYYSWLLLLFDAVFASVQENQNGVNTFVEKNLNTHLQKMIEKRDADKFLDLHYAPLALFFALWGKFPEFDSWVLCNSYLLNPDNNKTASFGKIYRESKWNWVIKEYVAENLEKNKLKLKKDKEIQGKIKILNNAIYFLEMKQQEIKEDNIQIFFTIFFCSK